MQSPLPADDTEVKRPSLHELVMDEVDCEEDFGQFDGDSGEVLASLFKRSHEDIATKASHLKMISLNSWHFCNFLEKADSYPSSYRLPEVTVTHSI